MSHRHSKIGRLPADIRDELNERLERSEPSSTLLAWVNGLTEVKDLLEDEFDGVPISKQNLCDWHKGGFQQWLLRREIWDHVSSVGEFSRDIDNERDNVLADDVATVLAAHYAALVDEWKGEVDEKFQLRLRALNDMCRSVTHLQKSLHTARADNNAALRQVEEEADKVAEKCKRRKLDAVWSILRRPMMTKIFGGGEIGEKIVDYMMALRSDDPGAKLDITEEDIAKAEKERELSKSGAKRSRAKKNGEKQLKTLDDKELDAEVDAEEDLSESTLVKVGQGKGPEARQDDPDEIVVPDESPNSAVAASPDASQGAPEPT